MRISVCMATYNGKAYVEEQLRSIWSELQSDDEVIVVDDASTDGTWEVLTAIKDERILLKRNPRNIGVNRTFEAALRCSSGDVVFLADQDDVWIPGRVRRFLDALDDSGALLASSNMHFADASGVTLPESGRRLSSSTSAQNWRNVIAVFLGTAPYYGCAMAFRRELLAHVLPFPDYLESHDLWIAVAANLLKKNHHIDEATLIRRIHGRNLSVVTRPWGRRILSRWYFLRSLVDVSRRRLFGRGSWALL